MPCGAGCLRSGLSLTNSPSSTEKMAEKRNIFLVGPMGAGKALLGVS